jgi:ketosteroid isomerase-like protein
MGVCQGVSEQNKPWYSDWMPRKPTPPVVAVIGFIDRINRGDIAGLGDLMTEDHQLLLFEEEPVVGKQANISAWQGYARMCPDYVIYPHQIAERDGLVAVLGHTTGSHLRLPDEEEARETLIWLAEVRDGALGTWRLVEDSPQNRREYGFA